MPAFRIDLLGASKDLRRPGVSVKGAQFLPVSCWVLECLLGAQS